MYERDFQKMMRELEENKEMKRQTEETKQSVIKKSILIGIISFIVVMILCSSITIVSAGHTGVVVTFGSVSDHVLTEGIHLKAPWQNVKKVDNRVVKLDVETESSTKDLQIVSTVLAVNYKIDNDMSYYIIKNIGTNYEEVIVSPVVKETLKAVTAKYTAEECITHRSELSTEIIEGVNKRLNDQGIKVSGMNITDFHFSDSYNKAIEDKQVAEQKLKKARTDKESAIVKAEADAEQKRIAAEGEAAAVLTKAEAQAKANELLNDSLSQKVIEYNKVNKWNGELPRVQGSGATIVDFDNATK